jgi:magnesium chelatase subunit D
VKLGLAQVLGAHLGGQTLRLDELGDLVQNVKDAA